MFDAVIFDMDGLLIDSEPFWQQAEVEVFATVGLNLTHEMCRQTTGLRMDEAVDYWFERQRWRGKTKKGVEAEVIQRVAALVAERGEPRPGVDQVLNFFANRKLPIALASGSPHVVINAALTRLGLREFFEKTRSAEDEELGKPHPAI